MGDEEIEKEKKKSTEVRERKPCGVDADLRAEPVVGGTAATVGRASNNSGFWSVRDNKTQQHNNSHFEGGLSVSHRIMPLNHLHPN